MTMKEEAEHLARFTREFGAGKDYVLAGGGNSSFKSGDSMLVKASGSRMATIGPDDFVEMDLIALGKIWTKDYPVNQEEREDLALHDLMNARRPGEEAKRPSVETLLHALFPQPFVMHTHPGLVNGMTCGINGKEIARQVFQDRALWIQNIEPGYTLAKEVYNVMESSRKKGNIVFLENHGVFVAGDSMAEIHGTYGFIMETLKSRLSDFPLREPLSTEGLDISVSREVKDIYENLAGFSPNILFFHDRILQGPLENKEAFAPMELALTPDHIVYAGFLPLFIAEKGDLSEQLKNYFTEHSIMPKIIAIRDVGCIACGSTPKASEDARDLFLDAAAIGVYAKSFGGPKSMPPDLVHFIRNWEVEKYRANK